MHVDPSDEDLKKIEEREQADRGKEYAWGVCFLLLLLLSP